MKDEIFPWLREAMTAILSLAVAAITLYMLCDLYFRHAGDLFAPDDQLKAAAYARQKDLLIYGLGLLGTVTGYYLGRAPAERQADAARSAQKSAEQNEATTKQIARDGAKKIQAASAALGGGAPNPVEVEVNNLIAQLQ